ncbi:hypothetical protein APY03_2123 [Variovorax sp. WDL1]|nr:hypothetical protein APY03_2123 [Variovorax sp. WDL1]
MRARASIASAEASRAGSGLERIAGFYRPRMSPARPPEGARTAAEVEGPQLMQPRR